MPASAVQTKTWFRPNGWFTDRETAIVVNRVLRDDPSKGSQLCSATTIITHADLHIGDMHNRMAITPSRLWHALKDYDLWPVGDLVKSPRILVDVVSDILARLDRLYSAKSTINLLNADS